MSYAQNGWWNGSVGWPGESFKAARSENLAVGLSMPMADLAVVPVDSPEDNAQRLNTHANHKRPALFSFSFLVHVASRCWIYPASSIGRRSGGVGNKVFHGNTI